ncbi:uncharacterized protein LOC128992375 [Macrosteles quadrilineatus]|uniref:uncharacterized protein LOC128992375 n=1 Tax=Macrosteles quadrilineatus TaxID=74068 RepID=UPI0023E28E9E|nr:uncharacterized protein LOC128992375 [Macrosteles quadrilineatus]
MMEHGKKSKTFEIDRNTERRPIDILQKTETLHGPKLEKKVISYTTTSSIPVVFAEKNMKGHGKKPKTFEIGSSTQKTLTYNPQSKIEAQSESMLKKNCISYTTTSTIPVVFTERYAKRVENKCETFGIDNSTKERPRNILQNSEALGESKFKKNVISYSTTSTIPVVFTERYAKRVENKRETFGIDNGTKERPRNVLQNSEAQGESKLKKNVISYSTTSIIPVVFTERNMNDVQNKFMSLLTDSPPESVKSLDFGESQDSDKQFNEINESIVSSDEESLQNLRDSIECTNGNLSPFSSIGSNSLNSSKRLKRRLLDSLDYTSDDSEYKSSSKFLRTDLLNSPSSETSEFLGGNVISSDDFAEPYDGSEKFSMKNPKGDKTSRLLQMNTSPQYDYNLRDGSIPDELTSGHPSSMNAASPFPSFSDEVNMRSSSDRGFADLNVDSPLYDRDMQSSDEDIDNYLVNIFDD